MEGVWTYHNIKENQSFRTNDCTSKLIQTCFEPTFKCARTKSESIVVNVFAPFSLEQLKLKLSETKL